MDNQTHLEKALKPEDLAVFFVNRANIGDARLVNGLITAEFASLQPDGIWLWIIDQPAIAMEKMELNK